MEEIPKYEQLFVLMNANARTGRREKGQVESKDSKILGAYGRDTLNDNGELLLSFANNGCGRRGGFDHCIVDVSWKA